MKLIALDWGIIFAFLALSLLIGLLVARRSGKNTAEYFLSGRSMPWWMLGMSMVATTFSTDTPNLVTDLVRKGGVAGNWAWWAMLITGMTTVFIYAKLWRRSGVLTDMEFYEMRYSGKSAAFLRGFRSLYLGIAFNVLAMAGVSLAAIKIGSVMLNLEGWQTLLIAGTVTVIFSAVGGFRGVIITDCILFVTAMVGAFVAAYYALSHEAVGTLSDLLAHENLQNKLDLAPAFDWSTNQSRELLLSLLIIPLAVQWWSSWYPGAEPGGGGYVAQRMLAAKNEKHAIGATFFFNLAHYALRPWPWIIVALASLIVYPDIASLKAAFPNIPADKLGEDIGYSAMLTHVPPGWLGLIMASLIAAYMSTISTHLNWGASYVVNDFYQRFVNPKATDKELIWVARLFTVVLMLLTAGIALLATSAADMFKFIIMFGAGTGLIFLLRWFWWRINAWAEIAGMVGSGCVSLTFFALRSRTLFGNDSPLEFIPAYLDIVSSVAITTVIWVIAMYFTRPTDDIRLIDFYTKIKPAGPGWNAVLKRAANNGIKINPSKEGPSLTYGILCSLTGTILVYAFLFATGYALYGKYTIAIIMLIICAVMAGSIVYLWPRIAFSDQAAEESASAAENSVS
ncbi:sodium:solute symporter family protein [Poriferisphaera sp. WC338]|uniref:sodium:solute symporter family protein n=1 Tax=Poriferisphaera sp. WC338 TaxID=3425129 RepID=UPI003D817DE7